MYLVFVVIPITKLISQTCLKNGNYLVGCPKKIEFLKGLWGTP